MKLTRNLLIGLAVYWAVMDAPQIGLAFLAGAALFHYGATQTNNTNKRSK